MSIRSKRWASLASVSLVALGLSVACGPLLPVLQSGSDAAVASQPAAVPAAASQNATPTAASARAAAAGPRLVPVQRGALTETLSLDGTVTAAAQEPVTYPWRSIVDDVKVKVGQPVKQGDPLIDFSSTDAVHAQDEAIGRLKTAQANLGKAQSEAEVKQADAVQKYTADQQAQQQVILDAQANLAKAKDNLTVVKAGRSPSERQVANTAVTFYGSTNLAQAQDALDKVLAGADPATIQAAQRDVANAQLVLGKAKADLANLLKGPDPAAVRNADLAVQKAQTQVQVAQAARIDPKAPDQALARQQHDLAVQDAQLAESAAEAQLAQLKQPPPDVDVQAAKFRVTDAESGIATAQAKVDALVAGPDQASIDAAEHGVEYARHALSELQASADEINSHPQPWELAAAEDQVKKAQASLDNALKPLPVPASTVDLSDAKDAVTQAQADVVAAQKAVEASHLRAPFDGTVLSIRVKAGDIVTPSSPLIQVARPGLPIVHIDLDDTSRDRIAVGQSASLKVGADAATALSVDADIAAVTPASQDGSVGAGATLNVHWPAGQAVKFGTPVTVVVTLQQKQNVLVVPKSAVKGSGTRTTVEIQDGTLRHLVNVQVGISTAEGAEIVSGLSEGQIVLASSSS